MKADSPSGVQKRKASRGGKTQTIKERTLYVYLPSVEMIGDWKQRADKGGISLSKFIIERVEDSIRRGELLKLDVDSIQWEDYSLTLKPTPKRSNRVVFFDDECAVVLRRWLKVREKLNPKTKALFVSYQSLNRFDRNGLYTAIVKYAERLGFHKSDSTKLRDHFGPHCFRHWFTTWLLRNGMPREYVKELRGDRRSEAIDIYHHIDRQELRKAYLAYVPKLGN